MEEKQFWIDFLSGKFSVEKMIKCINSDKKYLEWFKGIVPSGEKMFITQTEILHDGNTVSIKEVDFDLEKYIDYMWNFKGKTKIAREYNIFGKIAGVIKDAFPYENIEIDDTLKNRFILLIDVCPDYIGGQEAELVVEKILDTNPNTSKKELKNIIKDTFYIVGKNYPKWIQNPEWPISKNGRPMKFIKSEHDEKNEIQRYIFEDIDTKEISTVEQFF